MPGAAAPFTYLESSFGDSLTDPSLSFIPTVLVSTFYSGMRSEQIEADIVGVCMIADRRRRSFADARPSELSMMKACTIEVIRITA